MQKETVRKKLKAAKDSSTVVQLSKAHVNSK